MEANQLVISSTTMNRLKYMPKSDRDVLIDTIMCDEVYHTQRTHELTPAQELMYMFFHDYVMRDTRKHQMRAAVAAC